MSRTRFFFFGGGSTVPGFGGGGAGFAGAGAGTGVDGTSMTVESAFDGGASCAPMAAKLLKLDRRLGARGEDRSYPSEHEGQQKSREREAQHHHKLRRPTAAVSAVSASSAAVSPASASAAAAPAAASTPDASALCALLVSAAVARVAALAALRPRF